MSVQQESLLGGDDVSAVVFDISSSTLRAGYGGLYAEPHCSIPFHIGVREKDAGNLKARRFIDDPNVYIPREGVELKKYLHQSRISDWDIFESVFEYVKDDQLQFDPTVSPIFFCESNVYDRKHRETLAELMFEKYSAKAICIMPTAPLVIMKRDPSFSGVVLDIQTDQTTVSIVNHGFILRRNVSAVNFGSDDITDLCGEKLNKKNINFAANLQSKYPTFTVHESYEEVAQRKILMDFARTVLFCEKKSAKKGPLPIPNVEYPFGNRKCTFKAEDQKRILESFFKPSENFPGLVKLIQSTIDGADVDLRQHCYSHIFTNGEGTQFKGFCDRLLEELEKIPPRLTARLNPGTKRPDPIKDAWKQASIFVGTGTSGQLWTSKSEFSDGRKLHYF